MEGSSSGAAPRETREGDGSGAAPDKTMGGSDSGAAPDEMNPPAPEQGAGMKRSRPDEFLRTGHPLGLAPKKSLTLQAGQTASPGVTPISGRGGADVGAALAEPTASMVAPTPAEATERAASSVAGMEELAEDRMPPVIVTAPSQDQPGAVVVAPEGMVQSAPPGAHVDPPVAPEAVQTEEGAAGGSLGAAVVPHRKAERDRLSEEARLRANMATQLAIIQEREAQARQDVEEAHGMFEDLSARSKLDGEEIAKLQKERDELLQRNAAAIEKAGEILNELEMERDLRQKAESRATALQQKESGNPLRTNSVASAVAHTQVN
ncbi:uncharacterized protein [Miscanthus floridulus]|uniref:uncharacterized protein n=1 Tax=Miscanthus floridulus TaxID=154761 RepID=UPI0034585DFC